MERQKALFRWVQNQPGNTEDWTRILEEQQALGPSAFLPIPNLCLAAFKGGLLHGSNSGFIREVAEILFHVQPTAPRPKSLEELNLDLIAKKYGRPVERVSLIVGLMDEFGLIARSNDKEGF